MSKYTPKQFSPHVYAEWGELLEDLSLEKQVEILHAIIKYPNENPSGGVWSFIKSQIDKDYELFLKRSNQNKEVIKNYWKNKEINGERTLSNDNERYPTITNENEREPKHKHKRITNNVNVNNPPIIPPEGKTNVLDKFEEFWKEYTPVKCNGRFVDKGSKKTACEKFVRILEKGEDYENIIRGTREYINHCKENGQLTCGATVFLNQERWKCDYGATINGESVTKQREPRSILETYAEIAAKYQ